MDAVKINDQSTYALCITNSRKVIRLVDTLRVLGVEPIGSEVPTSFSLSQNFPNPFNPGTIIRFQINRLSDSKLSVYDINGRLVADLVNQKLNAGTYQVDFDGSNLSSGVYFYRLTADGNIVDSKRMVLLK